MTMKLMKGNEALAAAAIKANCRYFFGYPITPQNEVPEYMSKELPKVGGVFLQAESEIAAINMVYGAAAAGARVMTSSSSPGIALKQEGISFLAAAELPAVIVSMSRGGPGLGNIQPSQSDYYQATRGGGNGDYHVIVYAPENIQEMVDLVQAAFDVADYYRNPVLVLGDGMIGQMMEPVEFKEVPKRDLSPKDWATTGTKETRKPHAIYTLALDTEELEKHNLKLHEKYQRIKKTEARYESYNLEDAEIVICAYGTTARIAKSAIALLAEEGIKAGLIRPITVWPYPQEAFSEISDKTKAVLTVEMSCGQMIDDVKIALNGRLPVEFYGRTGGAIPSAKVIAKRVKDLLGGVK